MKIIKITATWCMSCIVMNEIFNKIEKSIIDEFQIINYDIDYDEEYIKNYHIGGILPVIIILDKNNNEINRLTGEKNYKEVMLFLKGIYLNEKK